MKNNAITITLSPEAIKQLDDIHKNLRPLAAKRRSVSLGKIVSVLILQENALVSAEKELLGSNFFQQTHS